MFKKKSKTMDKKGNALKHLNKKAESKINAWGAISKNGRSKLETFTQNMDSTYCNHILNTNLKELKKMSAGWIIELVSDNYQSTQVLIMLHFINLKKINRLEWPPYSPDLNPIESICGIIKDQLYKEDTSKRSLLTERVTKLWEEIDQSTIDNMIDGMHMRLIKFIEADRERINYSLLLCFYL